MILSNFKDKNFPKKAVILAGGKGTRLYPITQEIPKPLLLVKRKPIINYLIDLFFGQDIEEIAVLINKNFEEEFDWWQKRYYPKNKIKIEKEEKPLGTWGGIWPLKDWIGNQPFFLANSDALMKINLKEMNDFFQKIRTPAAIALVKVPDPHNYGVVICKRGLVETFLEKPKNPPTRYISSGLYLLSSEVLDYHPGPKFSMIEEYLFPKLAKEKKLAGFKFNGLWLDCGTLSRWETAIRKWNPK